MKTARIALGLGIVLVALPLSAFTNRVPNTTLRLPIAPPTVGYQTVLAFAALGNNAFRDPLALATPPGETNRLFVVEQDGIIAVITNLAAPNRSVFLNITNRVRGGVPNDEEGMLGLVFHPGYASNGWFFVTYSVNTTSAAGSGRHQRLARFQVSATNANVAATNELVLLDQYDEAFNHNGGDLHFGPDGYLYYSVGDEGDGNDTLQNSQRIDKDFFSGLLRLDVDNRLGNRLANGHPANTNNPARVPQYRVPADNPWVGATNFNGLPVNPAKVRTEFYAVGLRNPWRFSFDPANGRIWLADVGQNRWEEVDVIRRGGNYGWNYREGLHTGPRQPQPAVMFDNPILEYEHGSGTNQGNSVTGGRVYRGAALSQLFGAYVFSDYPSGNSGYVWALRYDGTNVTEWSVLLNDGGIAGFGYDPRNGDILTADQTQDTIKRLVYNTTTNGTPLPPTLAQTGVFTDLPTLATAPGIIPYELNVPFWSDGALKRRWFSLPNTNLFVTFNRDGNWSFPTGAVWIKHFELELTNGVPESRRRLETRLLVKNSNGVYGVTYRWGTTLTNATLVAENGLDEPFVLNDGGVIRTQLWHYPSRAECLACHTPVAGFALGFTTAQLNRDVDLGNDCVTNQLVALAGAGYFGKTNLGDVTPLPRLAPLDDGSWSLEWRVRSYLAANCSQCHQPGGTALGFWDARISNPLSAAGLINGPLVNNLGNTNNRVVVPGVLDQSILHSRIARRGPGQMPPLASSVLDTQAVALVSEWITNELVSYQTFAQWQLAHFNSTNAPTAAPDADPDLDRALNSLEFLTGTDPQDDGEAWRVGVARNGDSVSLLIPQIARRGFEVQTTTDLFNPASWRPLEAPGNRPFFSASNFVNVIEQPITATPQYYRVRVYEP